LPFSNLDKLLLSLRNVANEISTLVWNLVDLSSSIQIEQALHLNLGPHKDLLDSIKETRHTFSENMLSKTIGGSLKLRGQLRLTLAYLRSRSLASEL